jgi:hypothetical protein
MVGHSFRGSGVPTEDLDDGESACFYVGKCVSGTNGTRRGRSAIFGSTRFESKDLRSRRTKKSRKAIITYSVVKGLDPSNVGRGDFDPGDGSCFRLTDVSILDAREQDGTYHIGAGV